MLMTFIKMKSTRRCHWWSSKWDLRRSPNQSRRIHSNNSLFFGNDGTPQGGDDNPFQHDFLHGSRQVPLRYHRSWPFPRVIILGQSCRNCWTKVKNGSFWVSHLSFIPWDSCRCLWICVPGICWSSWDDSDPIFFLVPFKSIKYEWIMYTNQTIAMRCYHGSFVLTLRTLWMLSHLENQSRYT